MSVEPSWVGPFQRPASSPSAMNKQWEVSHLQPRRAFSLECNHAGPLISDFQPEDCERYFPVNRPPCWVPCYMHVNRLTHYTVRSSNSTCGYIYEIVEEGSQRDICIHVFTEALFTTANRQQQPKCPLTDDWSNTCGK